MSLRKAQPPSQRLRNVRLRGLAGVVVACAAVALALGLAAAILCPVDLFAWTGEESRPSQLVATWNLVAAQIRQMPDTRPETPVANVGMNPFGVNTFMEQEVEPAKRERIAQMIQDAGFAWIRQEFPWEDIEIHGKGDYEDRRNSPARSAWDKYDQIVDVAQRHGLQIIARLSNPPEWTRPAGAASGSFGPPDNLADYGDFVRAVVDRYKGRIRHYQIWNEPNIYPEWGESAVDPEAYTDLLRVGYEAVKSVDPNAVVICGALAATIEMDGHPHGLNDFLFLQRMYDAGAGQYFDVMAVQGYGLWSGPTDRRMRPRVLNFSRPQYIRDIMVRNGDAGKPIWMTEMNWNAIPADHPAYPNFGRVTLEQQADYARLAYRRVQAEWPWMGVVNFWFFKRASDAEKDQPMYYFRMVEPDFTPLPVYSALSEEAHRAPVMYPGYHQEDHWALAYKGDWRQIADDNAVLGGYRSSGHPDDTVGVTFSGTDLAVAVRGEPGARIEVACDEAGPRVVPADGDSRTVWLCRGKRDGEHRAVVRVSSPAVGIDCWIVRHEPASWPARIAGAIALAVGGMALAAQVWRSRS